MLTSSLSGAARCAAGVSVRLATVLALGVLLAAVPRAAQAADPRVEMTIANRGTLTIELYQKAAPKTVAHFLKLVNKKFYDGILFHRVLHQTQPLMAQAGDPKSVGMDGSKMRDISSEEVAAQFGLGAGGSGENIPFEKNSYTHERGTIAMARAQDLNSADSQFFINFAPNHFLDGQYCVFGRVIKGMDVVDKIQQGDRISSIRLLPSSGTAPTKSTKGKKNR